ncbi:MAG TPA: 30S ribosomal protein S6 [Dehalococcoidia bacterium]|nr:30S ribosomal protein S6 [Dehalococcoidia bacterium]
MAVESVEGLKRTKKTKDKETKAKEDNKQRDFEMVLIIDPEAEGEKFNTILDNVNKLISGLGGEVSGVEQWGKRKLAYPIKGLTEGNYVLTRLKMEPSMNKELEVKLKISEDVIRHLLIKLTD